MEKQFFASEPIVHLKSFLFDQTLDIVKKGFQNIEKSTKKGENLDQTDRFIDNFCKKFDLFPHELQEGKNNKACCKYSRKNLRKIIRSIEKITRTRLTAR